MQEFALIKTLSLGYLLGLVSLTLAAMGWWLLRPRIAPAARADVGFTLITGTLVLTALLALVIWQGVIREIIYMSTAHFHHLMHGGWGNTITTTGIGVLAGSLLVAWVIWLRGRTPRLSGGQTSVESGLTVVSHEAVTTAGLIGCWKPHVWINPAWWAQLSADEQRMALEHERCHLRRRDNLRKLMLHGIAALYGVLPFTRSWVRQYELDCELAVDDWCRRSLDEQAYTALIARSTSFAVDRPVLSSGMTMADLQARLSILTRPRRVVPVWLSVGMALLLALLATAPASAMLAYETTRCLLACYLGY